MVSPAQVMAAEWSMLAIAYVLVFMRLGVRVALSQKHLILSDALLIGGALCALGVLICDTISYRIGAMDNYDMTDLDMSLTEIDKVRFATNYLFDVGLYFPKLSLLAIYSRFIPRHNTHDKALYFVLAFTVGSALVALFADTFWCGPDPSVNWSGDPDTCSTFTSYSLFRTVWSLCFTCEVLIFLLPLPLLFQLGTLHRRQKLALALVFSLGVLTLAVSMGRCITTLGGSDSGLSLYIWAFAEFAVSIMVVACTALRPLVNRVWRAASSSDTSASKTHRIERSRILYLIGRPANRAAPCYLTNTQADNDQDPTDSEVELNDLQPGNMLGTDCLSISSERQCNNESLALDDGACKE